MKKFFYSVLAAATMLFATTSCSEDDVVTPEVGHDGNTQKVTFKVAMPGEGVSSRAIAEGVNVGGGNQADKLIWALYEKGKDANRLDFGFGIPSDEKVDGKQEFTAEISMVKGLTYNVLFFAYYEDGCVFQLNTKDPDLTALTLKPELEANVEGYDAFVKCHEHTVKSGNEVTTVTLKRPFAQINAATTVEDLDRAAKLQAVVTKSELVIKNVPTQYNVLTGEATANADLTYKASPVLTHYPAVTEGHPNEDITVNGEDYKYLAMAYVLAGATKDSEESMHEATFNFYRGENGDDLMRNINIINLPIQRNHRTNVIGDLLTETESFKIVIDEEFDEPDHNINGDEEDAEVVTVSSVDELQDALDAVTENSSTIIKLDAKIEGDVVVTEKLNAEILIDGCDNVYDGQITIYGGSEDQGATTIFKNIKFETSKADITFIWADASANGDYRRYPDNIVVDNCSFNAISDAVNSAVGLKIRALRDKLAVTNTTANGMHSLLQTNSCNQEAEEILVENVTITNGKNGLSFRNSDAVIVSNATITATGYGIRADGYTNYSIEVQDCNIEAGYPLAITNMSGQNYSIELKGNNTLTTDNVYQVVITNNKDEDKLEAPTGTYTLTGAEGFNVYPMEPGATMNANSTEQLSAAIAAGATSIKLAAGNYIMPEPSLQGKTLTIKGSKETVIDVSNVDTRNQFVTGATLEFDGITLNFGYALYMGFANTNSLTYKNCQINGFQCLNGENVIFENCMLDSRNNTGEPHAVWTYGAKNVNFTKCDFYYGNRAVNCYKDQDIEGGKQVVNFNECKFITAATDSEGGVEINSSAFSVGIEVNLEGCTAPTYGQMAYVSPWDSTNGAKTTINIK